MLKYSCKYKTKASSIYGEPNFAVINNLIKVTNLKYSSSILIPNAQDGIYVLPFARRFEHIDCYEDNIKLLDGGIIDNFECLGIRTRIKYSGVNNRIKLITKNYYSSPNNTKYDLVFAVRTLQLEENNSFSVSEKLHKLMENVKKGGYLYLMYYLNKDREIDKKQIIDYGYLKSLIDLNEWNIIYYRENTKRKTIHNAHPNNGLKHYHNVGNILLQRKKIKSPYVHIKRKCNRTYRAKSIYGNPDQQVYDYISFLKSIYKRNCDILVVDANDGKNVMPFARNNFNVTCFEDNRIFLHGGKIDNLTTQGLLKRIDDFSLNNNVRVIKENYYSYSLSDKYDFIYVENSLNLEKNMKYNMKSKIRKLMSNVREGGYLYIYYDLALDEKDFKKYPSDLYFRKNEIIKYFDLEDWCIEYIYERDKKDYCNYIYKKESRKVGYILAHKKRLRRKYKINYNIEVNNKLNWKAL